MAESHAALLAQISAELDSSFVSEPSLGEVVRLVVPGFADACSLRLIDGDRIRLAVLADIDPRLEALAWDIEARYPPGIREDSRVSASIAEGRVKLMKRVTEEDLQRVARDPEHLRFLRELSFRSAVVVPLTVRDAVFGVVIFSSRAEGRYDPGSELALAEAIGARIAIALENRRLYREAQNANRMKDEFLAMLSHELRSPLNAIVGWAELLQSGKLDAETSKRAIETIDRNAKAQARLIEDILDVSRIVAGKLQIEKLPTELAELVTTVVDSVRPAAMAQGIELHCDVGPAAVFVSGDPARLYQIVGNLLSNAIKFTLKGGRVDVRLSRSTTHAELIVQDTGIGIEPALLAGVFDRFKQADSTSTRVHKGLGLGLTIARHLAELHGGRVEGASDGKGKGATFRVILPLRAAAETAEAPELSSDRAPVPGGSDAADPARLAGLSILVVDDEDDARELLTAVLERLGARVVCAVSADDALVALAREHPDLLISDIEMPVCDGYELIRRVRRLPPEQGGSIPAAALTAYARKEDRIKAIVAGFNVHLAKPAQPAELAAMAAGLTRRA